MMNRLFCIGLLLIASSQATMPVFASESVLERHVSMGDTGSMARNSGTWRHTDLPLAFEENRGQTESAARFLARGRGYQIHLAPDVVGLVVGHAGRAGEEDDVHVVRLRFVGARSDALGEGIAPLASTTNYFVGSAAARPMTDAANYSRVQFDSVYPGISLVYYGNQRDLEYDMVVHPGADPNRVRLAIDGADRIQVDKAGNLQMALGSATVRLNRPFVYQLYGGKRRPIRAWFERRGGNEIAIRTAGYDRKHTLIIAPRTT
jgi:hypothetical protein